MAGALIHEWIDKTGGAEKVLDSMAEAFPDADIHCLWNDAPDRFPDRAVQETWLARTALRRSKIAALPVMPWTWRRLASDKSYDWMLISSHLFAHHARFRKSERNIRRFVYVHTPARYIWVPELDARGNHLLARIAAPVLKGIDRRRAKDPQTAMAANSNFVRKRIETAWGLEARVIYPPVDVELIQSVSDWREQLNEQERSTLDSLPEGYVLGASRFIPYKRLDLVIEAAALADVPVVIAGSGPEETALRAVASRLGKDVTFVIAPSTQMLYALYQRARAFVFPPIEDFGIMPVECMASGTPVVAYSEGGASESVLDGRTGYLVDDLSAESIAAAIEKTDWLDRAVVKERSRKFSKGRFEREIREWVEGNA